jgi:hypothetical protein
VVLFPLLRTEGGDAEEAPAGETAVKQNDI